MTSEQRKPVYYSHELFDRICQRISEGTSLTAICREPGMPTPPTVHRWISNDPALADCYVQAVKARAELIFDEILEITDDARNDWMEKQLENGKVIEVLNKEHVQRSKLRVDARKWVLGCMNPAQYGNFTRQELTGRDGAPLHPTVPVSDAQLAAALNALVKPPAAEQDADVSDLF